ncbi:MAG TPA: amidohydrolase [Desulfobulbus sp.]|nr:amidohydrolase [Desulfobulbus sp.]
MAGPIVADGAVVLHNGTIAAVGRFGELVGAYPGAHLVDHPGCVLMPGLINAHIHLELSNLAHLGQGDPAESFTGWIAEMLGEREALGFTGTHVEEAARTVLQAQYDSGVLALADIGNTGVAAQLVNAFPGLLFPFLEYLGLTRGSLVPALKKLEKADDTIACTAHAPYSTHPELIRALKKRADRLDCLFPIHVAEPASENSMLTSGRGEMADFLRERGFYEDVFTWAGIDIAGSVQYLHSLGVLNSRTLCVHAIHVSEDEISLLSQSKANVCLCPGSNRFLQVGRAPVAAYLRQGVLPALGTDSAASNPELSIWREMQLLAEDHPEVDPCDILRMATAGGAAALGIEQEYGTLGPGRPGRFLAVAMPEDIHKEQELCAALVDGGSSMHVQWVSS